MVHFTANGNKSTRNNYVQYGTVDGTDGTAASGTGAGVNGNGGIGGVGGVGCIWIKDIVLQQLKKKQRIR